MWAPHSGEYARAATALESRLVSPSDKQVLGPQPFHPKVQVQEDGEVGRRKMIRPCPKLSVSLFQKYFKIGTNLFHFTTSFSLFGEEKVLAFCFVSSLSVTGTPSDFWPFF